MGHFTALNVMCVSLLVRNHVKSTSSEKEYVHVLCMSYGLLMCCLCCHLHCTCLSHMYTYTTRCLDFILTYQDDVSKKKKRDKDTDEKKEKRRAKRQMFLDSCVELGLEYELQDCKVCTRIYIHVYTVELLYSGHSGQKR